MKEPALINSSLAGISCPRMNTPRTATTQQSSNILDGDAALVVNALSNVSITADRPEPFAAEAQHFVEMWLFYREVDILLEVKSLRLQLKIVSSV